MLLTATNQGTALLDGTATTATYARCALNFMVSFVVSNVGLLGGRARLVTVWSQDKDFTDAGLEVFTTGELLDAMRGEGLVD